MTHEEILDGAWEKALKAGWVPATGVISIDKQRGLLVVGVRCKASDDLFDGMIDVYRAIFSHNFAKAFWGEKESSKKMIAAKVFDDQVQIEVGGRPIWKEYLQQMVLSEDPIKYLEQFI